MTTPPSDPHAPRSPQPARPTQSVPGAARGGQLKSDNLRLPDPDAGKLPKSARNVLSREEIDALLNPDLDDLPVAPAGTPGAGRGRASPLADLDNEAAQALTAACDGLVARLSHAFQAREAVGAVLRLATAETRPFRATVDGCPGGGVFVCLSGEDNRVGAVLVLSKDAASALIERAGGASEALALSAPARVLTSLDEALLAEGLQPLFALFPDLTRARVHADRLRAGATVPPGDAIRLSLTLQIGTRAWPVTLLLDTRLLARTGGRLSGDDQSVQPRAPEGDGGRRKAAEVGSLTVVLSARIASLTVPLSTVSDLRPGMTLRLGLPADSPVTLHSGGPSGEDVAAGLPGREGERIAIRLTRKRQRYS